MALLVDGIRFYTMPLESLSICDEQDSHMGWVVYVDTGMVSSLNTPPTPQPSSPTILLTIRRYSSDAPGVQPTQREESP
ncbi:hypothetical protein M0802_010085 [Mischocyttarus mexicanus]|nr:hypothetical protein M0802_010085 [Mischocyttarus mexicanus]